MRVLVVERWGSAGMLLDPTQLMVLPPDPVMRMLGDAVQEPCARVTRVVRKGSRRNFGRKPLGKKPWQRCPKA